jgi:hypothetical protein
MDNPDKKILLLPDKAGRYHDKKLFDKETTFRCIPPDRNLWLNKGFQDVQCQHKNGTMPRKKSKNAPLTANEKAEDPVISALRMPIEHVFAGFVYVTFTVIATVRVISSCF